LIICAYYSWEMVVNFALDVSLDNMYDGKGRKGESRGSTKSYITSDEISR
jgi:hypothetical protein